MVKPPQVLSDIYSIEVFKFKFALAKKKIKKNPWDRFDGKTAQK